MADPLVRLGRQAPAGFGSSGKFGLGSFPKPPGPVLRRERLHSESGRSADRCDAQLPPDEERFLAEAKVALLGAHLGNDRLRRIHPEIRDFGQSLDCIRLRPEKTCGEWRCDANHPG
jgi:hypothetical protein